MDSKLTVVWLAPFPMASLRDQLDWKTLPKVAHPCSWIVTLARALSARNDIELHLITLCAWVSKDQTVLHPDGYTVHVVKAGVPFLGRGYPPRFPFDMIFRFWLERKKLIRKITELKPDVVHAHGTESAFGLAAMDAGVTWVVSIQGMMMDYLRTNPNLRYRLLAPLERKVFKNARFIGGRTHYDKSFATKLNPEATIMDMPEAMNECFFVDPWVDPGNQQVLFVGSCDKRKGLARLIESMGQISERFSEMVLKVVGGGSQEQKSAFLERAGSLGVKLEFVGVKSAEEIAFLHRRSCLFVIPSENENSPNSLAEAMASGMPVVAYDTGGIASMMEHDVSGLLVPFGDSEELSNSIARIFDDAELRITLGENARIRSERNRPERVAEATLDVYNDILKTVGKNGSNDS